MLVAFYFRASFVLLGERPRCIGYAWCLGCLKRRHAAAALQVYECLALLEGTSLKAQAAIESGTQVNLREAQSLGTYFQRVRWGLGRPGTPL